MEQARNPRAGGSGVDLWLILWRAFRAMEGHAGQSIAVIGLCWSDFGVMEALLHKGPLAVKALGEKVLLASGSMTAAIDRLERRGWVTRGNDPEDRRSRIVRLTTQGHKTIEVLFGEHERDMEQAAEVLSRAERARLMDLLGKLGDGGGQRSGIKKKGSGIRKTRGSGHGAGYGPRYRKAGPSTPRPTVASLRMTTFV
jgi:MarR family transcriptional regulator, 2-MHQ and catechol-resistance regulon repressor